MSSSPTTTRYLLDTNVLVHYIRGNDLGRWIENNYHLQSLPTVPLISVVTEGEIRSLALQLSWGQGKIQRLQKLVDHFVSVPLDFTGVIEAYARIDHYSRTVGRKMGKNDAWIAATAYVTGARLLTTDGDFDHLGDFLTRDWIDPNTK